MNPWIFIKITKFEPFGVPKWLNLTVLKQNAATLGLSQRRKSSAFWAAKLRKLRTAHRTHYFKSLGRNFHSEVVWGRYNLTSVIRTSYKPKLQLQSLHQSINQCVMCLSQLTDFIAMRTAQTQTPVGPLPERSLFKSHQKSGLSSSVGLLNKASQTRSELGLKFFLRKTTKDRA